MYNIKLNQGGKPLRAIPEPANPALARSAGAPSKPQAPKRQMPYERAQTMSINGNLYACKPTTKQCSSYGYHSAGQPRSRRN